jgi:hypothetical protein
MPATIASNETQSLPVYQRAFCRDRVGCPQTGAEAALLPSGAGSIRLSKASKGFQFPFVCCIVVAQNVKVSVVSADFVETFVRPIPLIENFLDHVFMLVELKPHGPLIRLPAGIALYSHGHRHVPPSGPRFHFKRS